MSEDTQDNTRNPFDDDQEDINIVALREQFKVELQEQVDSAFANRINETHIPELAATQETINQARKELQMLSTLTENKNPFSDEPVITAEKGIVPPNVAYVLHSHDYPLLLQLAFEKLVSEYQFPEKNIPQEIENIIKHEYQHHVPALGKKNLAIRYQVAFFEDKNKNTVGFQPSIHLSGTLQLDLYHDIVSAVTEPSATDTLKSQFVKS